MAKFEYRMQNILDVKLKMESQAKIAYGIANTKLMEEQKKLQKLMVQRAGYEREARELVTGTIDVMKIKACRQSVDTMKSLIRTQMMQVHTAEKNLEVARRQLSELMVERKTHEKLKEKAFEEFKKEIQYSENKEIDELVSYTYHDNEAEAETLG